MREIIPAIMAQSYDDLRDKMSSVVSLVKIVQVDVMDGKFVPTKSWPMIKEDDKFFLQFVNQEEGLPFWEELNIEADLMVADPHKEATRWAAAGASRIIIHYASAPAEKIALILKELKDKGVETGLAFTSKTSQDDVDAFIDSNTEYIDFVQCMGIERIGFQEQPFDEQVLLRLQHLKTRYPNLILSVDGAVHFDTAAQMVEAGADRLVSGSEIYEPQEFSIEKTIKHFEEILDIA